MASRIPTVKLKLNFCYIQIIVFDLKLSTSGTKHFLYFSHFYNLNVTEVRDSDLKKVFPEFSISRSGSYWPLNSGLLVLVA